MKDNEDLYEILNIDQKSTQPEIKRAYHKLAKQYHPDKHQGNPLEANIRFQKINYAYMTLSDTNKREFYDLFASVDIQSGVPRQRNFSDIFSSIYDLMKNMQEQTRETDRKLEELCGATKRPASPESCSSSNSSYDEDKAMAWLLDQDVRPKKRKVKKLD